MSFFSFHVYRQLEITFDKFMENRKGSLGIQVLGEDKRPATVSQWRGEIICKTERHSSQSFLVDESIERNQMGKVEPPYRSLVTVSS